MAFPRFTPRQLEAFLVVAETRNFRVAGERLGLSTSAISQLVAELETAVEFRLFDRSTRNVALSAAGREFLGPAQSVMRQMSGAVSAATDIRERASGIVRVAAPLALAATVLPEAIEAYAATHPRVVVRIRDAAVDRLVDAVSLGEVDLAVGPDRQTGPEVARESIFASPWVLWCARDHALARRGRARWSELRDHQLVATGHDHERGVPQMRLTLPDDERVVPVDVVENLTTALGLASRGLAATLAPAYVERLARAMQLVMRRVGDPEVMREVCMYRPTRRANSPAAQGFAEFLAPWLARWACAQRWSPARVRPAA